MRTIAPTFAQFRQWPPQNRFWAKLRPSRIYEEHCCPIPGTLPLLEMLLLPPCTTLHWCAKWHCPAFANGSFSTRNHCPGLLRMKRSQEKDKTSHNNFAHRGVERETDWHGSWSTTHLYCSWQLPLGCPPSQVGQWIFFVENASVCSKRERDCGGCPLMLRYNCTENVFLHGQTETWKAGLELQQEQEEQTIQISRSSHGSAALQSCHWFQIRNKRNPSRRSDRSQIWLLYRSELILQSIDVYRLDIWMIMDDDHPSSWQFIMIIHSAFW